MYDKDYHPRTLPLISIRLCFSLRRLKGKVSSVTLHTHKDQTAKWLIFDEKKNGEEKNFYK